VPGLFIPSKSTLEENYSPLTFSAIGSSIKKILRGFVEAFSLKPFRKLCIATFFIYNAFMTISGFVFFIIVWYLYSGDAEAAGYWTPLFGSAGALVTTFIVIPIVARMSKIYGKKKAFLISQAISIVGYASLWFLFVPGKPWMYLFALPFHSFGIGSLFTLMMSMTADVIDLDELKYGVRREGIFGAIYWYMVKFGFAIAGGASGIILTAVGFDGNLDVQPEGAITGLRLFFSGLPILGTLIALIVMWDYDVTEERSHEVQAELARIKATKKSTAAVIRNKLHALDKGIKGVPLLDLSNKSNAELRALMAKRIDKGIHGLCFSPYEEDQQLGDILTRDQIRRRMDIIAPSTKWVRSFSCSDGNELIPEVAHEVGLKTMAGAWISNDQEKSQEEIDTLIELARKGCVDIAVVGNEVLLREELKENEIIAYIMKVREAVPNNIQVGYVDAYYQFIERPALVEACDVILANCYPFWEGIDNEDAAYSVQRMYELTKEKAQGKKVIITETGWPGKGESVGEAHPTEENAMKFFINIQKWSGQEGVELFYFSSFDEPWKVAYEGEVGAQWGLWDKNEKLKYT
jgi:GPH family glycoside/pentoside/hexuronide:cation symporter